MKGQFAGMLFTATAVPGMPSWRAISVTQYKERIVKPISILLLRGRVPSEELDTLSETLQCAVVGCVVADDGGHGGTLNTRALAVAERRATSSALHGLYRVARTASKVDDPVAFARRQIRRLQKTVVAMERAIVDRDEREIVHASEYVRFEAEDLAFSLQSWDAEQ